MGFMGFPYLPTLNFDTFTNRTFLRLALRAQALDISYCISFLYCIGYLFFLLKHSSPFVFAFLFSLLSPPQMFHAFGNLPPCAPIAVMPTTLVLTSANIVVFKPLRRRARLVPPEFLSIFPPSIVESPLFSQSEPPNLMKSRNADYS